MLQAVQSSGIDRQSVKTAGLIKPYLSSCIHLFQKPSHRHGRYVQLVGNLPVGKPFLVQFEGFLFVHFALLLGVVQQVFVLCRYAVTTKT
jgi:hypothetical protein